MIAGVLLQALLAVPGFEAAVPMPDERVALPHVADALRGAGPAARRSSSDAALARGLDTDRLETVFRRLGDARAIAERPEVRAKLAHYPRAPASSYRPALRGWRGVRP